jgi:hypothetical protein
MMEPGWFRYPLDGPTIIGGDEYVTVDELVQTVIDASGKEIAIEHVEGPIGVPAPAGDAQPASRHSLFTIHHSLFTIHLEE